MRSVRPKQERWVSYLRLNLVHMLLYRPDLTKLSKKLYLQGGNAVSLSVYALSVHNNHNTAPFVTYSGGQVYRHYFFSIAVETAFFVLIREGVAPRLFALTTYINQNN